MFSFFRCSPLCLEAACSFQLGTAITAMVTTESAVTTAAMVITEITGIVASVAIKEIRTATTAVDQRVWSRVLISALTTLP